MTTKIEQLKIAYEMIEYAKDHNNIVRMIEIYMVCEALSNEIEVTENLA